MTPATIRYGNPGGQYPGPSARRWGSTGTEIIGGGHKIAVFPDPVKGAAAQFDLLNRGYAGLPLNQAIRKWSGGNSADAYVQGIVRDTGLAPDTVLTPQLLSSPQGLALVKRMAQHEAGRPYPLDDTQWSTAQRMALGGNTEGAAVAPKPGSAEYWNSTRARPGQPAMPPLVSQMATGQPGQPQQQQGGWNLYDALTNPLTMMGLSILGSPTRDVGQGIQTFQQGRAYDDRRAEMARQRMVEEQQQKAFQSAVAGAGDLGPMAPVIQALGPERGTTLLAQLIKEKSGGDDPSNVREWKYYNSLPENEKPRYLAMKRAQQTIDLKDSYGVLDPTQPGQVTANIPKNVAEAARQEKLGEAQGEGEATFGKTSARYAQAEMQDRYVLQDIDRAISMAGPWTTGFKGSLAKYVAETPASDMGYALQSIEANLAFDKLEQLKAASPTGGALGQVTERELDLLKSTWGSIQQAQSEDQFRYYLNRLKEIKREYAVLRNQAYEADLRKYGPSGGSMLQQRGAQPFVREPSSGANQGGGSGQTGGGWGFRKID